MKRIWKCPVPTCKCKPLQRKRDLIRHLNNDHTSADTKIIPLESSLALGIFPCTLCHEHIYPSRGGLKAHLRESHEHHRSKDNLTILVDEFNFNTAKREHWLSTLKYFDNLLDTNEATPPPIRRLIYAKVSQHTKDTANCEFARIIKCCNKMTLTYRGTSKER